MGQRVRDPEFWCGKCEKAYKDVLARNFAWVLNQAFANLLISAIMILIYKKIKKRNERKKLEEERQQEAGQYEDPVTLNEGSLEAEPQRVPEMIETVPEKEELSPEEKAAKKKRRVYRWKLILGLFGPFCLQSLDTTIIASALPYIAEDFRELPENKPEDEWILTKDRIQTKSVN